MRALWGAAVKKNPDKCLACPTKEVPESDEIGFKEFLLVLFRYAVTYGTIGFCYLWLAVIAIAVIGGTFFGAIIAAVWVTTL